MPMYTYTALALDGSRISGTLEAANKNQLSSLLKTEDLFLIKCRSNEERRVSRKLKTEELADFCRQLSAMLSAGIMLIRAMSIISQRNLKPPVQKVYRQLIDDLQRGSTLSEAMAKRGQAFPELLINMIRAGENTGQLDLTTQKMAVTYDKEHRLKGKIRSALVYPAILLLMIVVVVGILFTFVLPQFMGLFENMELPWPTQVVMGISDFLVAYGLFALIATLIICAALIWFFHRPAPRRAFDRFKLRIPSIGRLLKTIYTARFARTLASLYVSGIPMIQALIIARSTIGNSAIEAQFAAVIDNIGNGRTLSQSLALVDGFEPKLHSTVLIGEESGSLEQMLDSLAEQYEYDSEIASQQLVTIIEPVMIVLMALIVAFVIIAVLLPIYELYSTVGTQGGL